MTKTQMLGEVAAIQSGYQVRGKIIEDSLGTHHLIRTQDFDEFSSLDSRKILRFFPSMSPQKYLVRDDDVLLPARSSNRLPYFIHSAQENMVAAHIFYIIRVKKEKILPEYLYWWLGQPTPQAFFVSREGQSTIAFISKSDIRECPVEIPDISTQKKIARLNELHIEEKKMMKKLMNAKSKLIQAAAREAVRMSMEEN